MAESYHKLRLNGRAVLDGRGGDAHAAFAALFLQATCRHATRPPASVSNDRARSSGEAVTVAKGLAANRLVAAGYGQERPIGDNRTAAGRATNRRVDW